MEDRRALVEQSRWGVAACLGTLWHNVVERAQRARPLLQRERLVVTPAPRSRSDRRHARAWPSRKPTDRTNAKMNDSISLMFYGASGPSDRVKQIFEARRVGGAIEVIITQFRPSEVCSLVPGNAESPDFLDRIYDACKNDLRMLRGWPAETEFEAKRPFGPMMHGVEGRVVFQGGSGRARAETMFNAPLNQEGKISAVLPIFPHIRLEIAMSTIEDL